MHSATQILLVAALVGTTLAATKVSWPQIHAKWSGASALAYTTGSAFFDIPTTKADAGKKKWVEARQDENTSLWCMDQDPRVCTIYDKQGSFAGMQVCFPQEDLANAPYRWQEHKKFIKDNVFGVDLACGRFFLVPQETIQNGGRASFTEVGSGLWVQDGDSVVEMPLTKEDMLKEGWTEENCIPGMGRHYYYNVTETMDCQAMEPYFLLTHPDKDYLHALGFQTFGKKTKVDREWWEAVPSIAVKPTIPNAPQCLVDWAEDYGVVSLHVYFVKGPYFITCPLTSVIKTVGSVIGSFFG